MDTLTHGLLGLAIGALRKRDGAGARAGAEWSPTDLATSVACVIAAELPDLDYLWPSDDAATSTLRAHRGLSHSLIASPLVAAVAVGIAMVVVRARKRAWARPLPVFAFAWVATVVGHLVPDLWTGWGTRLLLPLSDQRLALDWTMVIDPLVTLPLAIAAIVAIAWHKRGTSTRAVMAVGLAVAGTYVGARAAAHAYVERRLATEIAGAREVDAFPTLLRPWTWRWVATVGDDELVAGTAGLFGGVEEQARHRVPRADVLREASSMGPSVEEALAWARFPLVERSANGRELRVADLRYHFGGRPTLTFVFELDARGRVVGSRLDRGGTVRELMQRWRG